MFGLFGAKKQERELRSSLSTHKFEMEFPRVLETFKLTLNSRGGKSQRYAEVEAGARFIATRAVGDAVRQGHIKNQDDLVAAAAFTALVCDFLARNGGLEDSDVKELQGFVPSFVLPKVAAQLMGAGDFRNILTKGILKYETMGKKAKYTAVLARLEDQISQFICMRDLQYLDMLGGSLAELRA